MEKRIKKTAAVVSAALAAVLIYYLIYKFTGFGIPCLFNLITGLKCPGCGNTRAIDAILSGEFSTSLSYNYLMPLEVLYIVYTAVIVAVRYIRTGVIKLENGPDAMNYAFLAVLLIWWVARNIAGV